MYDYHWMTLNSDNSCPGSVNCIPQLNNRTTDFVVFCGQNGGGNLMYANGYNVGIDIDVGGLGGNIEFGINDALDKSLRSDFGIMEIAVWNRFLTESEIVAVSGYYLDILNGVTPQYQLFVCSACTAGTFSTAAASTACNLCDAGTYSTLQGANTLSACTSCRAGKYSSVAGAGLNESLVCESCLPGTYSTVVGAVACSECAAGQYSTGPESLACSLCPTGSFSTAEGAFSSDTCAPCSRGSFAVANGSSACLACAPGSFSTATGARASNACAACRAGTYSTTSGASASGTCTACDAGTYSTLLGATAREQCSACQSGTFSSLRGASNRAACVACPAGKYADQLASSVCSLCLPGYRVLPAGPEPEALLENAKGLQSRFGYAGWDPAVGWVDANSEYVGAGQGGEGDIYTECTAGAGAQWVCAVKGLRTTSVRFGGQSVPPEFTVCSVTRYNGPAGDQVNRRAACRRVLYEKPSGPKPAAPACWKGACRPAG